MIRSRVEWLDISKGIAITLVVYGHVTRGLEGSHVISFNGAWGYIDYIIYSVHMPLFFSVSGYLFERFPPKNNFWQDKVITIVWPYVLWTAVQVLIQSALSGSGVVNSDISLSRLLSIGWDPVTPFWFLYSLFVAFSVSMVLYRVPIIVYLILSFLALIVVYQFNETPIVVRDIFYGLAYFTLGRLFYSAGSPGEIRSWPVVLIAWLAYLAAATLAYYLELNERIAVFSTFIGLYAFFVLSLKIEATRFSIPLIWMGRCTMGIYVMHIIVSGAVRAVGLNILHAEPITIVIAGVLLGIALPMIVQVVSNRIGIAKALGLATKVPSRKPGL